MGQRFGRSFSLTLRLIGEGCVCVRVRVCVRACVRVCAVRVRASAIPSSTPHPYSLPAPLFFNEDDTPDLLVRVNKGQWEDYDYSYMAVLDGRDGRELWTLNSSRTGMMSGLSIASDTHGWDATVFLSIGTPPDDGSEYPWVFNDTTSDSGLDRSETVSDGLGVGHKNSVDDTQGGGELEEEKERIERAEGDNVPASRPRVARSSSDSARCSRVYFEGPGSKVCRWYEWLVDGEGRPFVRVKRHGDDDDDDGGEAVEAGDEGEESGGGKDGELLSHHKHAPCRDSCAGRAWE